MLRVTTLRASGGGVANLLRYYAGLAQDRARGGPVRGPVDYYLDPDEPPGRWWGEGCAAVGLAGEVQPDQLERMLQAHHPSTGRRVGRGFGDRSARGFDATFSAPKSVSLLWALSPDPWVRAEVLAAHDTAVEAALGWFAEQGAHTRRGTDGVHQVDTRGVVAGLFRQHRTGKWLALDARFLKRQQRSIGWVYDAALRTELTARLGVDWDPIEPGAGQADFVGVPGWLRERFSERSEQVAAKLGDLIRRWVDEHDGADPDPRTLYLLERKAVVASRPGKEHGVDAAELHRLWRERALQAGFDPDRLHDGRRRPTATTGWNAEAVIDTAIDRVTEQTSSWLRADIAREIATLLPADATESASDLVALIDGLAAEAEGHCQNLHPPATPGMARRSDGRAVTEHVTDRQLTTDAILDQERRLLTWASAVTDLDVTAAEPTPDPQRVAAAAVAGNADLVPSARWRLPAGTTVILDEAGMARTDDLDRLVVLACRNGWRLVCVGDPEQLPAVGRGGMFAHWCDTLPAHRLDQVHRFTEDWQGDASLLLRRGDPSAAAEYAQHGRLHCVHPALVAERIARQHQAVIGRGETVAITTSSASTARAINLAVQQRADRRIGRAIELVDGTQARVGDRIVTRRNDPTLTTTNGTTVRNRHAWTVTCVHRSGDLTVTDPELGKIRLPAAYAARHVELGWAVTGYGTQGGTTDHGICVIEPTSSRAGIYVGMTRGRGHNIAWILDPTGLDNPEDAFAATIARPANGLTAHAVRDRLAHHQPEAPPETAADRMRRQLDRLERQPRVPELSRLTRDSAARNGLSGTTARHGGQPL